ncbi:MAG: ribonucleoside triphosphate reductase, partial [Clostridia bacterium]|nr:ribonucleoside triphosphate reductase [Clostridia bacterium]
PYTRRYLGTFDNHFSTIGLIGMNEAGLNACWLRKGIASAEGRQFAKDVLNHMREKLSDYQEQYGALFNLEATPAESTTYRLAKHDVDRFPDIITAAEPGGEPFYTNSSHLPVGYTDDVFEALEIQDELQTLYTSGTVFHAFLGEKLPDWKAAANLVRKIAENHRLPYYTLSPTYSVCNKHGYITGEVHTCPECGEETEVYSRITGYYRPVKNWNAGKTQEFKERKLYDIDNSRLRSHADTCCAADDAAPVSVSPVSANARALLFSRVTCPNCRVAESLLGKAGFEYEKLIADDSAELCRQFNVKGAPTLVITDSCNTEKFYGVPEIKKFLASEKVV